MNTSLDPLKYYFSTIESGMSFMIDNDTKTVMVENISITHYTTIGDNVFHTEKQIIVNYNITNNMLRTTSYHSQELNKFCDMFQHYFKKKEY